MAIRERAGRWHYRFKLNGRTYAETTGLAATPRNKTAAMDMERKHRLALLEGRNPSRRVEVREFNDAAADFLEWAKSQYRQHPNSFMRIKTSFTSLKEFLGKKPVSLIDEGDLEDFKAWRVNEHDVRDVTIRHDLHALSKFFSYALKKKWARENPVRNIEIPSDADAIREHILTEQEEKAYFEWAAKHKDLHDSGRLILQQLMRPEEVLELRKENVDFERKQITVSSGKSKAARRTLDLTTESCSILASRMKGISPWLFPSPRNHERHRGPLNGPHVAYSPPRKKLELT